MLGWYNGPFPPPGFGPVRESAWRMLLRSAVSSAVVVAGVGIGLFAMMFVGILALVALFAAVGGGDDTATARTRLGSTDFVEGAPRSKNRLLSIEVNGIILGEKDQQGGLLSGLTDAAYGYEIKDQLLKAAKEPSIKGVVLELNTPGGTIFGAQAIADGVRAYREQTGKPVVAFVKGLSASGGMWAMAPATRILADHGSVIGSIGVIMGTFAYYDGVTATEGGLLGGGVTTRNGIQYTTISAGRGKDIGSPYRQLTDEERTVLQRAIDNSYDAFVKHIATTRNIPENVIRDRIGALVYDNLTAQQLGLIDGTASRQEAYREAARLAELADNDWQVVRKQSGSGLWSTVFSRTNAPGPNAAQPRPGACLPRHAVLAYYGEPSALCPAR
ncbi:MAG: S49 family peptidase [Chloroflexi bacterium]|nr:S49 family peptidase [Chloroflexota bacterium]